MRTLIINRDFFGGMLWYMTKCKNLKYDKFKKEESIKVCKLSTAKLKSADSETFNEIWFKIVLYLTLST